MAAVNFPDPSASPWKNPDNGVTYEYSAGTWKAVIGSGSTVAGVSSIIAGSGISVDQATGDVTITNTGGGGGGGDFVKLDDEGTKQVIQSGGLGISDGTDENITLNSDGSVTFAGGASTTGGSEIRAGNGSGAYAVNDGFGKGTYAGSAMILNNPSGNTTCQINSGDGSATFAGEVKVGDLTTAAGGVQLREVGSISLRRDGSSSGALTVYNGGTSSADASVTITNDGSATFAQRIRGDQYVTSDNVNLYMGAKPGNRSDNFGFVLTDATTGDLVGGIKCDGGAEFTGTVTAPTFSGNASSATNADYAYISQELSANANVYPAFVGSVGGGGYARLKQDTALSYNPSQNKLVCGVMKVTTRFDLEALSELQP